MLLFEFLLANRCSFDVSNLFILKGRNKKPLNLYKSFSGLYNKFFEKLKKFIFSISCIYVKINFFVCYIFDFFLQSDFFKFIINKSHPYS